MTLWALIFQSSRTYQKMWKWLFSYIPPLYLTLYYSSPRESWRYLDWIYLGSSLLNIFNFNFLCASITFQKQYLLTKKTYIIVTDINSQRRFSKKRWYSGKYKLGVFDRLKEDSFINFYKIQNFKSIQACDGTLKNQKGNIHLRR